MIDRILFGQTVKLHRKSAGMTVSDLAEAIDVSPRYIYHIEAGERMPCTDIVIKLISVLNINIIEIAPNNTMQQ